MATSIELHELGAAREELMTRIKTALVEERERAAHSWTALAIESERQRKHLKLLFDTQSNELIY